MLNKILSGRVFRGIGANLYGQGITIILQVISLPIYLSIWSPDEYGIWLMLSAIPAYFALSDMGFLVTSINNVSMRAASGDVQGSQRAFSTAMVFCLCLWLIVIALLFLAFLLPDDIGGGVYWSYLDVFMILILVAVVNMSGGLLDGVFRANDSFATGMYLLSTLRIVEWTGGVLFAYYTKEYLYVAMGQLGFRLVGFFCLCFIVSRVYENITWTLAEASVDEFRSNIGKAVSFMAFPAGNVVSIQGMALAVGSLFGPAAVVVFNIYRTLSRVTVQLANVVSRSVWPEISKRIGEGNVDSVWGLYVKSKRYSGFLILTCCVTLYFLGSMIFDVWIGSDKGIIFDEWIFSLFLISAFLNAGWQIDMAVLAAGNMHREIAIRYLAGSVFSIGLVVLLGSDFWIAPVVMIFAELFLFIYSPVVVKSKLKGLAVSK